MALEQSGLNLKIEGLQQAITGLEKYQTTLDRVGASTVKLDKTAAKARFDISGGINKATSSLSAFNSASLGAIPGLGSLTSGLGGIGAAAGAVSAPVIAAGVAIAGLAAAAAGFYALGKRGAALQPVMVSFSNIVGGADNASLALNTMRGDVRGTISDFELMRLTVQGLQGTTGEFRAVVGKDFGAIIDITQRVAQATGQSAEIVREKFILGLRRQSAKLLDDVGVVVDATAAYKKYAEQQGLVASSLTATQKQAAYAAEAIAQLRKVGEETGSPAATLEALKTPYVAFTNILDKLSLAIQPAFAPIVGIVQEISQGLTALSTFGIPMTAAAFKVLGTIISTLFDVGKFAMDFFMGDLIRLGAQTLPYLVAAFQIAADAISAAFQAMGAGVKAVLSGLGAIIGAITSLLGINTQKMADDTGSTLSNLIMSVSRGGGRVIGAFAAGLLSGGKYVIDAVTKIAQIVADFLEGFSPPKKGPLSKIDIGGENVAKAWAEGFQQGVRRPIEDVAAEVNDALGKAGLSGALLDVIDTRLKGLDSALQPFKDSLDIVKSQVEAIAGFIDPALKVIERQQKTALEAFSKGKTSAETVRAFDQQLDMLNQVKDAEQDRIDRAELQLKLAEATQAQERALLNIAKQRVPAMEAVEKASEAIKEASATGGAGGTTPTDSEDLAKKAAKAGGGGGAAGEEESGGMPTGAGGTLDLLGGSERIEAAKKQIYEFGGEIASNFSAGLEDSGYGEALAGFMGSRGQLDEQLARIQAANPVNKLKKKFEGLGDIATAPLDALKNAFDVALAGISALIDAWDISSIGTNINNALSTASLAVQLGMGLMQLAFTTAIDAIKAPFAEGGAFSASGIIAISLVSLFGDGGTVSTALSGGANLFHTFVTDVSGAGFDFMTTLLTGFQSPMEIARDKIKESIESIGDGIITFVNALPGYLSSVAATLNQSLVNPFINAVNAVIGALESAINGTISGLPGFLRDALREATGLGSVSIGRIPTYAGGGMAGRGLAMVGERGPELVNFGQKAQVFPANLTRALMSAVAQPMPVGGGGSSSSTYNQQRSVSNTFNNVNPQQSVLMARQLEAGYR